MELHLIIEKLQEAFESQQVKEEVLLPEWFDKNKESGIDSTGFCYSACEVIYKKTGGQDKWKLGRISKEKWVHGGHCFLIDKETNERLDITANQYNDRGIPIPYELADIGGGFGRSKKGTERAERLSEMSGIGKFNN